MATRGRNNNNNHRPFFEYGGEALAATLVLGIVLKLLASKSRTDRAVLAQELERLETRLAPTQPKAGVVVRRLREGLP